MIGGKPLPPSSSGKWDFGQCLVVIGIKLLTQPLKAILKAPHGNEGAFLLCLFETGSYIAQAGLEISL